MSFIRTVLGDIDPPDLGPTDAHEHLAITGGRLVELEPDALLADVDRAVAELSEAHGAGLRAAVDAMPCDAGRDVRILAEISRRAGVHVIAATGLHLERYYDDRHWSRTASEAALADRFTADVTDGIDADDHGARQVGRTSHRAGVVKVAGSREGLTELERRVFAAAATTHHRTGAPILTHATDGRAADEQVELLLDLNVDPGHLAISHVDGVADPGYHRALLGAGATLVYDQALRWPAGEPNGTLDLLERLLPEFPDRIVLGLDAGRRRYWHAYGGSPGLVFLPGELRDRMAARGIGPELRRRLFATTPARLFSFVAPDAGRPAPVGAGTRPGTEPSG